MFRRIGMEASLYKIKAIVCTPRFIWGEWGATSYKKRATGEGVTFRECNKTQLSCTKCGVTVAASYLNRHMSQTHDICIPQKRGFYEVGLGLTTYVVSFHRLLQEVKCLVPGCLEAAHSTGRLRKDFMYRHFQSKVAVVQEGAEPLP